MGERQYEMGAAELEVLRALWDGGAGTVRQVMERLHGRRRKLAYTTVLTFLTRLEEKGLASSNKSKLAYVYRAKVSRERVGRSRVKRLMSEVYDGSAGPLVMQLVRSGRLTREEIDELHKLIEELDVRDESGTIGAKSE